MHSDMEDIAACGTEEEPDGLNVQNQASRKRIEGKTDQNSIPKRDFVDNSILFSGWPTKFRRALETSLTEITLPYGSTLLKQGDPVEGIYFIIQGQAKLVVNLRDHRTSYKKIFDDHKAYIDKQGVQYEQKERKVNQSNKAEHVRIRRDYGFAAAEKRLREKYATICLVDKNECIGDLELVMGMRTHHHAVICTTKTEVYFISNEAIERLIMRRNPQTMAIMRTLVEEKLLLRSSLKNSPQVELYSAILWKLQTMNRRSTQQSEEKSTKSRERDLMVARMVKLFLAEKMPFIEPRVPDTVYHKMRCWHRDRRSPSPPADTGRTSATPRPPSVIPSTELRLAKAKLPRRKARSRRQLQRLQSTQEENKHLDLSLIMPNSTINRKSLPPNKQSLRRQSVVQSMRRQSVTRTHPVTAERKVRPQTAVGVLRGSKSRTQIKDPNDSTNGIFKLTQTQINEDWDETNSQYSESHTDSSERQTSGQLVGIRPIPLRPKSAPFKVTYDEESCSDTESDSSDDCFDLETSNTALELLEDKIRKFHDVQDNYSQKTPYKLRELRRFTIQNPGSIPVAGGTVFVRPRPCEHHQNHSPHHHVRTFMVPQNAYAIAAQTLNETT